MIKSKFSNKICFPDVVPSILVPIVLPFFRAHGICASCKWYSLVMKSLMLIPFTFFSHRLKLQNIHSRFSSYHMKKNFFISFMHYTFLKGHVLQLEHMNTECTLTKYRISRFKLICCRAAVEEGAEASATPLRHPGRAPPPAAAEGAQVCLRNAMYKHDTRNLHRLQIFPHPLRHRCAQVQVGISYYFI